MRATRPLFRLDPGWLFIIAGLAVCAAGVLLPAQADLRALEDQLTLLQDEEARAYQRLAAHAEFIDQIDRHDPSIIKRLAATQLNLVPEGVTPVLLAAGDTAPVTEWIDNTVVTDIRPGRLEPDSTLSRWAIGPNRLWMFGGGIMAVFIGLLISPEPARRTRREQAVATTATASHALSVAAPALMAFDDAEDEDDHAFDAMPAADDEDESRIAKMLESLPATVDLDSPRDLAQQEDTVDLEEDELPARARNVIDDDAGWHAAATVEHASEVMIEAKEVAPARPEPMLWEDENDVNAAHAGSIAPDAGDADADDDSTLAEVVRGEDDDWTMSDEERLATTSMLMPKSDDDEDDEAAREDDATPSGGAAASDEAAKPSKSSKAKSDRKPPAKPRTRNRKDEQVAGAADGGQRESAASRKPKPKPSRKTRNTDEGAASIPFLRYRPDEDDEEEAEDGIDLDAADDSVPTMLVDDEADGGSDAAEAEAIDDDEAGDDDDSPMKFRGR